MTQISRTKQTKLARSAEIFDQMSEFPRHDVVAAFQKLLDMSPACASTYYQLNRQRIGRVGKN